MSNTTSSNQAGERTQMNDGFTVRDANQDPLGVLRKLVAAFDEPYIGTKPKTVPHYLKFVVEDARKAIKDAE